LRRWRLKRKS